MATAKKLPSGSWRCQVFSHYEPVFDEQGRVVIDPKTKRSKKKRIYESFTSNDPACRGKIEAEILANEFYLNRKRKSRHTDRLTLFEAIEKYITVSNVSLSPKTIEEYWKIRKNCFQSIMDIELRNLTDDILQDAITVESQRPNRRCTKNTRTISPKTVRNAYGPGICRYPSVYQRIYTECQATESSAENCCSPYTGSHIQHYQRDR